MKAGTLNGVCKIASKISNPSSLTSLYQSIEVGPDTIRCVSEFGNINVVTDPTGLTNPVLLDCKALQSIAQSLPQNSEITLEEKVNKINWSCDEAKGHLNFVQTDYKVPDIIHDNFPWEPAPNFGNALMLAASACQAAAVSLGLYGITIEPLNGDLHFFSCNTISLAETKIDKGSYPAGKVTIRPPVPGIIAALIASCPNCRLDVAPEGIFIFGDWLKAQLPIGADLDHDIKSIAKKFEAQVETTKINSTAVKKFVARAKNLTERQSNFTVDLKVEGGKLILTHTGIASSTEQYFLAEGLPITSSYQSVTLPGDMLLLPLEFIQVLVLDYLKENQLVLRGDNPQFTYVVSGGA